MQHREHVVETYPLADILAKKRILLYPAASGTHYLLDFFRAACPRILSTIVGLGDADPNKAGLRQDGFRVYPPDRLAALEPDLVLLTSPALRPAMERDLRARLGADTPILLADDMAEYLEHEAGLSALAAKLRARPFDPQAAGPAGNDWYHSLPLGGGRLARSLKGALTYRMLDQIRLPADLTGKSVLDLAASDGFYGFECEARGASRVVSVEWPAWSVPGGQDRYLHARALYGSRAEPVLRDIEAYLDEPGETFDLVLFLGIYYHLPDPLGCFRKLFARTRETLIVTGRTVALSPFDPVNMPHDQIHWADPGVYTGRPASIMLLSDRKVGKWTANIGCLIDLLRLAGFSDVEVLFDYCPPGSLVSSTALAAHR